MRNLTTIKDDWEILMRFLPKGWVEKAYSLGALVRMRKIDSPSTLLRVLLIHLAEGMSLRSTAAYAKEANLCDITDVALLHRLKKSSRWLKWIASELAQSLNGYELPASLVNKLRFRLVDGSSISEPGSTGSDWRLHYSFNLTSLGCDTFLITDASVGEGFKHFPVKPDDLLIGDRGYCTRKGVTSVVDRQGDVLVRFHSTNFPLKNRYGNRWPVLEYLRGLKFDEPGDWNVWYQTPDKNRLIKGRLCAIRKSKEAVEQAKKSLRRSASKHGRNLRPETLEFAEYIVLFTTANRYKLKVDEALTVYRCRWQIELVFKRLKSILGMGHLPKFDSESCKAWLHGKLLVAFLVEHLRREAEFFSPWGYPV